MTVYQVWDWDPYASRSGEEYLAGTYASRTKAEQKVKALNAQARRSWMANCSPEGAKNYVDRARIEAVRVK